jgi:PAS domain S-box-containing protein
MNLMDRKSDLQNELELLRKENRILRALQESSVDGILVVDENARIISCNQRFIEMMHVPRSILDLGNDQPLLDHVASQVANPGAFMARVRELYQDQGATGHDEIHLANGNIYDRYTTPMSGPENIYYGRVWYFHDITEIRHSEKSLQSSEERFRAISEYSLNAICTLNAAGKVIWVNDAMIKLSGYTRKQVYAADSFIAFLAPESVEFVVSNFMKFVNREKYMHHYQFFLIRADGEKRLIEKHMSHYDDHNGELNLIISMMDITEVNKAELALRLREEDLNHAQEIARMGSWELNFLTGEYTWSRNNYLLAGLKPYEIKVSVEYFMQMVHPDDLPVIQGLISKVSTEKLAAGADLRVILPDGSVSWIQNNIVPVLDGETLTGMKGVNIDITEKRARLEKIRLQNERLNAIISAMPDLIFVIDQAGAYREVYCSDPKQLLIEP